MPVDLCNPRNYRSKNIIKSAFLMYRNGCADHGASRDKGPHRGFVRYRFCCNLRQDKRVFQENPKPNSPVWDGWTN